MVHHYGLNSLWLAVLVMRQRVLDRQRRVLRDERSLAHLERFLVEACPVHAKFAQAVA